VSDQACNSLKKLIDFVMLYERAELEHIVQTIVIFRNKTAFTTTVKYATVYTHQKKKVYMHFHIYIFSLFVVFHNTTLSLTYSY